MIPWVDDLYVPRINAGGFAQMPADSRLAHALAAIAAQREAAARGNASAQATLGAELDSREAALWAELDALRSALVLDTLRTAGIVDADGAPLADAPILADRLKDAIRRAVMPIGAAGLPLDRAERARQRSLAAVEVVLLRRALGQSSNVLASVWTVQPEMELVRADRDCGAFAASRERVPARRASVETLCRDNVLDTEGRVLVSKARLMDRIEAAESARRLSGDPARQAQAAVDIEILRELMPQAPAE
jgi:hypothetical protein